MDLTRVTRLVAVSCITLAAVTPARGAVGPCSGGETWTKVGQDTFRAQGLQRSQGAASDGTSWYFSWQGSVEKTDDLYVERGVAPIPAEIAADPEVNGDGTNHVGGNHIGDLDVYDGIVYAPIEDGGQGLGVTDLNDPEYQRPYIALYDAETMLYTGVKYAMPLALHAEGIPWVAVDGPAGEVFTAEWDMPRDRINVFNLDGMGFKRFIDLRYPASFGAGFHLTRIQGAKVFGGALYASRDDATKSIFKIDLATGDVSKVYALDPGIPSEIEGLAVRATPDGASLHVLIIVHNDVDMSADFKDIAVEFHHLAVTCAA